MPLTVRPTIESDLPALVDLFNHTVRTGGTTAHEEEWDVATFKTYYFDKPVIVHTVLSDGAPIGFQAVDARDDTLLSIASFTDQRNIVRGAGAALFDATRAAAQKAGYTHIQAKIRGDNVPGLAYYSKMGFADHKIDKGVPLADGTPVDRVTKLLTL